MMIKIRLKDLEKIILHCEKESPVEACGILAGKIRDQIGTVVKEILKVYDCKNEFKSAITYRIEAEEQFKVFSEIDSLGLELLGFYHSHPNGLPRPSLIDKEKANYYGYSYMIIALHPTKICSWVLEKKGFFKKEEIQAV